jgi:hypothetical protein
MTGDVGVTPLTHPRAAKYRRRHMTEDELSRIVEAKLADRLAARLQADRERVRAEVVDELRREAARQHYDRINARHPIEDKYGGLGPEGHAARLAAMDARAKAANAHMDEVNSRPVPGSLAHQRSLIPGSEGFRIKG